jgi:hypothetical protein
MSIEVEIAYGLAGIGRFLRLLDSFLELLFQEIGGMLLGFNRLPEDRVSAAILLFHGTSRGFYILEHFRFDSGSVSDDRLGRGIDFQNGVAAGTGDLEGWRSFWHKDA